MGGNEMNAVRNGYAVVELHNHAHLCTAYGDEFGAAAMRTLQRRVYETGGIATLIINGNRFLARLPHQHPIGESGRPASLAKEDRFASSAELWRAQLTREPLAFGHRQALPVLTITAVGDATGGVAEPGDRWAFQALENHSPTVAPLSTIQHSENWRRRYADQMAIALAFHHALTRNQANLVFQPIVRSSNYGHVLYHEALLRMEGDSPARVVPVLEEMGMVDLLDRAVIAAVIDRLQDDPALHLGCNLSALSLAPHGWWDLPLEQLAAQPELAARLTLEITETAPIDALDTAVAFTRRLRALGCQIALDDFGAGYSSPAFALAVRPQVIKLDAGLVRAAARSGNGAAERLAGMAYFCKNVAKDIVAEGIEDSGDLKAAVSAGINWFQGHWVALPAIAHPQVCLHAHPMMECSRCL